MIFSGRRGESGGPHANASTRNGCRVVLIKGCGDTDDSRYRHMRSAGQIVIGVRILGEFQHALVLSR